MCSGPVPDASIDIALPFLVLSLTVPSRYFAGPGTDHLPFVYRLAVTICQRAWVGPLGRTYSENCLTSPVIYRELATVRTYLATHVYCCGLIPYSFRAPASLYHLRILDKLLSPTPSAQALGPRAQDLRTISIYLLRHDLYSLLAKALGSIVRTSLSHSAEPVIYMFAYSL